MKNRKAIAQWRFIKKTSRQIWPNKSFYIGDKIIMTKEDVDKQVKEKIKVVLEQTGRLN